MNTLRRLFKTKSDSKKPIPFSAKLNPDHPVYAIGDIHGRFDLLEALLKEIREDIAARKLTEAEIVFVGDYIDRGEDSAEVLKSLMVLPQKFDGKIHFLMGNHEKMMLDFLETPEKNGARWMRNGGLQTLAAFGVGGLSEVSNSGGLRIARNKLKQSLPVGTVEWLKNLNLIYQSGNVFVVHAAADPALNMYSQSPNTLLWGHRDFPNKSRCDGNWVIHGHTVVDEPTISEGKISIDTGAYFSNRLSAVCISGHSTRFFTV